MPAYSLQTFSTTAPASGQISLLFSGSFIIASNVSTTGVGSLNWQDAIDAATTMSFDGISLPIISSSAHSSHFFLQTSDTLVDSSSITVSSSLQVNFIPTPAVPDTVYRYSEFNPQIGSANTTRNEYSGVFKVDQSRSGSSLMSVNYKQILAGTAVAADIQESFYTSKGIDQSRYSGSVSSKDDYGIEAAFRAVARQGAFYADGDESPAILSQSNTDKNIQEYFGVYEIKEDYTIVPTSSIVVPAGSSDSQNIPTVRARGLLYNQSTTQHAGTSGSTIMIRNTSNNRNTIQRSTKVGDYIFLPTSASDHYSGTSATVPTFDSNGNAVLTGEIMKIVDAQVYGGKNIGALTSSFSMSVERNVAKESIDSSLDLQGSEAFGILLLTGDTVLRADGNRISKAANVKIFDKELDKVFLTGEDGRIIHNFNQSL